MAIRTHDWTPTKNIHVYIYVLMFVILFFGVFVFCNISRRTRALSDKAPSKEVD